MLSTRHLVLAVTCLAASAHAFLVPAGAGLCLRSGHAVSLRSRSGAPSMATRVADVAMMGTLADKYGHLRGKEVEPCDKAVERFYKLLGKPVPFIFRSATNEILYITHLDLVNAMFEKDLIWNVGLYSIYDVFFQALDQETRTDLFNALMGALKLEPSQVKSDAETVLNWASGKTEADVVAAFNGQDSSPVGAALARIKNNPDFLYTRNFGAGLIKIMQLVGIEPNAANAKRWAEAASFTQRSSAVTGVSMSKFEADVGSFLSSVEKMQQAMQLFADAEAREKKKVAERLAEKAARAAADAA